MKRILIPALLVVSCTCRAQTPATHTLPNGSTDMYLGIGLVDEPVYEGSKVWQQYWNLDFQAQWSNGLFVSDSKVGLHLSDDPGIEYGPMAAWGGQRPQSISPKTEGLGGIYSAPFIGGFYKYMLPDNVQLTTDLLYGTGRNRGGILCDLDVRTLVQVAAHHKLSLWAGMTWANNEHAQLYYGITPQQALTGTVPAYAASAGIQDVHAGVNWNWELSPSWLLNSKVYATHLMGSAVGSPLVDRTDNISVSTGLAYRF